jgi:predicted DCC family thiol-disulfide oxidoreductase YuxK
VLVARNETMAGLLLAAFALGDSGDPLGGLALADDLSAAAHAQLDALGLSKAHTDLHERRERALRRLASVAAEPALASLPQHPRAAALLAPLATAEARVLASALPIPRRGYRAPRALQDHLRRLTASEPRDARAQAERDRMEARPWRA